MAKTAHPAERGPIIRREHIACPNCGKSYQIEAGWLGASGRSVRCQSCGSRWFEPAVETDRSQDGDNPVLSPEFPGRLKKYLQALPEAVKNSSPKSTHAIKTFLMRYGLGNGAVGFANGIRVNLPNVKTTEFLWDAVGKVLNRTYPGEDYDLTFAAESENQPDINKIIEDANKLPIVRADVRLMFFRANDQAQCAQFFDRLHDLFRRHRKSEPGDTYIMAGMDMHTLTYMVRRLTLQRPGSNANPWEEF
ncbi:MAG TPA: zinc-ribbon domain-containing protein [Xanthobacteraceae bacterium]|nr:zinc-ribbon domain-containing protein [Xanthobacteraceae bacterium]